MSKTKFNCDRFLATMKVWRKMHGFSIFDMCELTGIARSTFGFIESGDRCPTIAELSKLCQLMDFDVAEFFDRSDVKNGR